MQITIHGKTYAMADVPERRKYLKDYLSPSIYATELDTAPGQMYLGRWRFVCGHKHVPGACAIIEHVLHITTRAEVCFADKDMSDLINHFELID